MKKKWKLHSRIAADSHQTPLECYPNPAGNNGSESGIGKTFIPIISVNESCEGVMSEEDRERGRWFYKNFSKLPQGLLTGPDGQPMGHVSPWYSTISKGLKYWDKQSKSRKDFIRKNIDLLRECAEIYEDHT